MERYRFLLLAVFFIIPCNYLVVAQDQQKVDSLKQLLIIAQSDSVKMKLYGHLSWIYAQTREQTKLARKYADSIKFLAEKSKNQFGIAKYNFYYGVIDRFEDNQSSGIKHLKTSLDYNVSQGDSARVAGDLYQLAVIQGNLGNYKESLALYYRVLDIEENDKNEYGAANALLGIGNALFSVRKHDEAITHYDKALAKFTALGDTSHMAGAHIGMGNVYVRLHEVEKTKFNYKKGLELYKKTGENWGVALAQANIAFMYNDIEKYDSALVYHKKALSIRETLPNKEYLGRSLLAVGLGHLQLKSYKEAKKYVNRALDLAKKIQSKPIKMGCYEVSLAINEEQGRFKEALDDFRMFISIKDSVMNDNSNQQINELQTKYETAQKDQEITLLTKENEIHQAKVAKESTLRNALIGGLILLAIIAGLIFYTMRARLKSQKLLAIKNEEIKMAKLKERMGTLEMKALRAQMNPHFLFNGMNSINRMIVSADNDRASKYLTKFSKLVRLMLENSENPKVSLKDELAMLKAYIELESIRFKNKLEYTINFPKSLDQDSIQIPSMVLQPFVENAIWHGLLHKAGKGLLTIDIKEEGDNLYCSITDNGVGREQSLKLQAQTSLKKKSMGIKITTDRLKLLTKQKINEAIKILDLKDERNNVLGTRVNILIPIS